MSTSQAFCCQELPVDRNCCLYQARKMAVELGKDVYLSALRFPKAIPRLTRRGRVLRDPSKWRTKTKPTSTEPIESNTSTALETTVKDDIPSEFTMGNPPKRRNGKRLWKSISRRIQQTA